MSYRTTVADPFPARSPRPPGELVPDRQRKRRKTNRQRQRLGRSRWGVLLRRQVLDLADRQGCVAAAAWFGVPVGTVRSWRYQTRHGHGPGRRPACPVCQAEAARG